MITQTPSPTESILRAAAAAGARPDPSADDLAVGRQVPDALATRVVRTGPVAHRPDAVPARDHGLPLAHVADRAHGLHERRADRRDGVRQQLDRVRDPPGARPDDGGAAHRRDGQAQLEAEGRSSDRGVGGAAEARSRSPVARLRQHGSGEGVSGRRAGDDRRQLRGRPPVDGRAVSVPGRDRRVSRRCGRRGRPDQSGAGAHAGRSRAAKCSSSRRRRSPACRGSRRRSKRATSGSYYVPCPTCREYAGAQVPAAPVAKGRTGEGGLRLRALRPGDPQPPEAVDAPARPVARDRPRAMARRPASTCPASTRRSVGSRGEKPPSSSSRRRRTRRSSRSS